MERILLEYSTGDAEWSLRSRTANMKNRICDCDTTVFTSVAPQYNIIIVSYLYGTMSLAHSKALHTSDRIISTYKILCRGFIK